MERDGRLWRLSLCMLMGLLSACATTPQPEPKPEPLIDRTADTNYQLEPVKEKLAAAQEYEQQGNRALAVAVVETAQSMLAADLTREHEYLEVVRAAIWARQGDGHDSGKAAQLLEPIAQAALKRNDSRLLADIDLARVVLLIAQGDKVGAARAGDSALRQFAAANAHARGVEAGRELAFQFLWVEDLAAARTFARRAHADSVRIDDEELLIQTCLDVGRIELATGDDPEAKFLQAYEAAYRIDSLGWRNVVIALACDAWYAHDDVKACIRWADRLRERGVGKLPALKDTDLYHADYITLLSQYYFAHEQLARGDARGLEAARLALSIIDSLAEDEKQEWLELAENLRGGLLQPEREK